MSNIEKDFLKSHNITERISFKDGMPHTFKILKRKLDSIDNQGVIKEGLKYLVSEAGTPRSFFTSAISLIQKLAEIEDGRLITVQMKSKPNGQGGFTSYFDVSYPQPQMKQVEDIPLSEPEEIFEEVKSQEEDW